MRFCLPVFAALLLSAPGASACVLVATCTSDPTSSKDLPSCAEYDFDTALLDALDNGDTSVLGALRQRFDSVASDRERYRIAGVLIEHDIDRDAIWPRIEEDAANAVRFSGEDGARARAAWCAEHGWDEWEYDTTAQEALMAACLDGRSRPLLLEALQTSDMLLIGDAVAGFAIQRDDTALPAIERALARLEEGAADVATLLAAFHSAEADRIAYQYLNEEGKAEYDEARRR